MLFKIKNKIFCITNELFNKRKKIKKTCIQIERLFNILKASVLQFLKSKICTEKTNMSKNDSHTKEIILHV